MRRLVPSIVVLASASIGAQTPSPSQVRLTDVVPGAVRATQFVLTPDARRVYYGDTSRAIWFYDRTEKRSVRLTDGDVIDLTLSPTGDALAYAKSDAGSAGRQVWVLPLDSKTGLPAGDPRRASTRTGDTPSISPDGKWLAFAANDSTGVGQAVVVWPLAGGRERTVVSSQHTGISNIRWSPDGRSLYFGVNPPVTCNPDWSCLPLKPEFTQTTGSIRRVSVSGGNATSVAQKIANGWPGLSTDGALLAYTDTGFPTRLVVADPVGRALHSFPIPPRQTVEGWLSASTLVFSDRGDIRRLRSYSLVDGSTRLLVDSLDQLTDPVWSPDGRMIDFARCILDHCELRLVNADGSPIKTIPLPDRYGNGSIWSPDQQWIAYVGGPPNGERHVNLVEVATGRVQQLAAIRSPGILLLWAPDSRSVIASANVGGTTAARRLLVQRAEPGAAMRVLGEIPLGSPPSGGYALDPTTAIVLRDGGVESVVFVGDSSVKRLVPRSDAHIAVNLTATSDGKRVAIRRTRGKDTDDLNVLEIMNKDGSEHSTIEVPFPMFGGPSAVRFLAGGEQLVVMGLPAGDEREFGIYLVTVATKAVKKLFSMPFQTFSQELAVSPDGRSLLYVTSEYATPRVFTMDLSSLRPSERK